MWGDQSTDQRWSGPTTVPEEKRRRRTELRAWVYEYKEASSGCARCDESDPVCLEFYHVDANEKTMSVGSPIEHEPSRERLVEEIGKCELLCRNCHRKEHYEVPVAVESDDESIA